MSAAKLSKIERHFITAILAVATLYQLGAVIGLVVDSHQRKQLKKLEYGRLLAFGMKKEAVLHAQAKAKAKK